MFPVCKMQGCFQVLLHRVNSMLEKIVLLSCIEFLVKEVEHMLTTKDSCIFEKKFHMDMLGFSVRNNLLENIVGHLFSENAL